MFNKNIKKSSIIFINTANKNDNSPDDIYIKKSNIVSTKNKVDEPGPLVVVVITMIPIDKKYKVHTNTDIPIII
jgi:hypothetical protein